MEPTKLGICLSATGLCQAILGFIAYTTLDVDIQSAIWSLLSGIYASLALMLHHQNLKESLHANFSKKSLQYIGYFGIFGFASGLALAMYYLFIEIYYKADNMTILLNMRLVWSLMMANWSFVLFSTTRKYLRDYSDNLLISENPKKRNPLCIVFQNADRFV